MALIVEDGTGLVNAEAYQSVADAQGRIEAVAGTDNAFTNAATLAAQEQALRGANRYLQRVYAIRWRGRKKTQTQSLFHPAVGIVDYSGYLVDGDSVPEPLKLAEAELALRWLEAGTGGTPTSRLQPDPTGISTSGGAIVATQDTVGPLSTRVEYAEGVTLSVEKSYPSVDALLRDYIYTGGRAFLG